MPGITGIIQKGSAKESEFTLSKMINCMMHEPFYTAGSYTSKQLGLSVGWVNQAGSFSDCMPVWNEGRDACLIFAGENFADKALTDRLKSQGHIFDPYNASYLIHLYEELGSHFLEQLNGWFSGILIDLKKELVVLFNDRYGMQRTYCHENEDALYFSSEAKALLSACPELRRLDMKSLGEVFSFGCVLENRSLFSGVFLLPSGSAWICKEGKSIRKERYFMPDQWENQPSMEKEEFYKTLRQVFVNILPRYFDTNNKIALSLTGGMDTRMILSYMNFAPGQLPCYTFGGMYRDCYDVKVARKVADVCRQTHRVLELDRKFFLEFPNLAEKTVYITDGSLDVTGSVELYVNRQAREIAPVRLTGNYGSEIMRGAVHLKAQPARDGLFSAGFEKYVHSAAETLRKNCRGHKISFVAFKQAPWYHYNRLSLELSQLTLRSPYMDNDLVGIMYRAPVEVLDNSNLSLRLIKDGSPEVGAIMTDRGLGGNNGFLLSNLAHLYREFLFKADYAFNYGMPQWLAKMDHYLLAPLHVERLFLGRHKFYHFRLWFRDELSGYVKDVMLDRRSLQRSYLNVKFVEKMVLDHTSGRLNYTNEISKLLTIELLQRLLIDGSGASES